MPHLLPLALALFLIVQGQGTTNGAGEGTLGGLQSFSLNFLHGMPRPKVGGGTGTDVIEPIDWDEPTGTSVALDAYAQGFGLVIGIPFVLMMATMFGCLSFCLTRAFCDSCGKRASTQHYRTEDVKTLQISMLVFLVLMVILFALTLQAQVEITQSIGPAFEAGSGAIEYVHSFLPLIQVLADSVRRQSAGLATLQEAIGLIELTGANSSGALNFTQRVSCLSGLAIVGDAFRRQAAGHASLFPLLALAREDDHLSLMQNLSVPSTLDLSSLEASLAMVEGHVTDLDTAFVGDVESHLNTIVAEQANLQPVATAQAWAPGVSSLRSMAPAGHIASIVDAASDLGDIDAVVWPDLPTLRTDVGASLNNLPTETAMRLRLDTLRTDVVSITPTLGGLQPKLTAAENDAATVRTLTLAPATLPDSLQALRVRLDAFSAENATLPLVDLIAAVAANASDFDTAQSQSLANAISLDDHQADEALALLTPRWNAATSSAVTSLQLQNELIALATDLPLLLCGPETLAWVDQVNASLVLLPITGMMVAFPSVLQAVYQNKLLQDRLTTRAAGIDVLAPTTDPLPAALGRLEFSGHIAVAKDALTELAPFLANVSSALPPSASVSSARAQLAAFFADRGVADAELVGVLAGVEALATSSLVNSVPPAHTTAYSNALVALKTELDVAITQIDDLGSIPPYTLANAGALQTAITGLISALGSWATAGSGTELLAQLSGLDAQTLAFDSASGHNPDLTAAVDSAAQTPVDDIVALLPLLGPVQASLSSRASLRAVTAATWTPLAGGANVTLIQAAREGLSLDGDWASSAELQTDLQNSIETTQELLGNLTLDLAQVQGLGLITAQDANQTQVSLNYLRGVPALAGATPSDGDDDDLNQVAQRLDDMASNLTEFRFRFVRYRNAYEFELVGWDEVRVWTVFLLLILGLILLPLSLVCSMFFKRTAPSMLMALIYIFLMIFFFGYAVICMPLSMLLSDTCLSFEQALIHQASDKIIVNASVLPPKLNVTDDLTALELANYALCRTPAIPSPWLEHLWSYPSRANSSATNFSVIQSALEGEVVQPAFYSALASPDQPDPDVLAAFALYEEKAKCERFQEDVYEPVFAALCANLGGNLALSTVLSILVGLCLAPGALLGILGYKRLNPRNVWEFELLPSDLEEDVQGKDNEDVPRRRHHHHHRHKKHHERRYSDEEDALRRKRKGR